MDLDALDFVQVDSTRVAGLNENLAILLLARKFDKPVCPHAGGVGLCNYVQQLAIFDQIAVGASSAGRVVEWLHFLQDVLVTPINVVKCRYMPPAAPGFGVELTQAALREFRYPDGPAWRHREIAT